MIQFLALLLFATSPIGGQPAVQTDPRIRTLTYDANQVVRLQVPTNFHVAVLFEEQVENVALGNSSAWEVTLNGSSDALFIKPIGSGSLTNMTVITDARVYTFELVPAYGSTPDTSFTVRFDHSAATGGARAPDAADRLGRYRISGSRLVRPIAVVDDGVRTLIEWGPSQPIPAMFSVDERGAETLLEGHMRDGLYVIDAVHTGLAFRLDRQTARASRLQSRRGR